MKPKHLNPSRHTNEKPHECQLPLQPISVNLLR